MENENPNIFVDFIVQSGSFADYAKEEIEKIADLSDCLFQIDLIEKVLKKDQQIGNYTWQCTFINIRLK